MNEFIYLMGCLIVGAGGGILLVAMVGLLMWLGTIVWIGFSDNFRVICKAESLIFEYRKNREKFLVWMEGQENGEPVR